VAEGNRGSELRLCAGRKGASEVEAASDRAGQVLGSALRAVLRERETVRLAIPGGSALAAATAARAALGRDWSRIALTWVDERCVPEAAEDSNRGAARRAGLLDCGEDARATPAPARVLPLFEDGETPAEAVARVESRLGAELGGQLDVLLLGMGADGHVASLFPGRPVPAEVRVAHVADSPKPPADRITLTRPLLETARHAVLLATGEAKREALERLLAGDPTLPAQGLAGLVVVTDLALDRTPGRKSPGPSGPDRKEAT
jgi:6-phosphogluconolactonase